MTDYLILFALVFGVNLLPAFGPPTWSILVFYGLNFETDLLPTVLVGAGAAASGRFILAHAFRFIGDKISAKTKANVAVLRQRLEQRRAHTIVALGLFALGPVPSAQLFEAAGLARLRLAGFTLAFFAGRLVSYTIYLTSARTLRESSLGDVLQGSLSSPWGIALQVVMIGALIALLRIDWAQVLRPRDRD